MHNKAHLTRRALAALFAAGLAGTAATTATTASRGSEPLTCEIHVREGADIVALEAVITAAAATDGTYELHVSGDGGAGNSDVTQSGAFSLSAGERSAVGSVTMASTGGAYIADLAVTTGTEVHRCTRRIVGSL